MDQKLMSNIEQAFSTRIKPASVTKCGLPTTPEQLDAEWFLGRDWCAIDEEDWRRHPDAFNAFTPEAFIYYLPSVLVASLNDDRGLLVTDSLLNMLDRSPVIENWDNFLLERMIGLRPEEYDVLQSWILALSGRSDILDEDGFVRCYETLELLRNVSSN